MSSQLSLEPLSRKTKKKSDAASVSGSVLSTAKGSGVLAIGKVVETAGRFVVALLLARLLGADQFGQYTLALAASALVASVGKLGMDSALVRYIAIFVEKQDEAGLWGVIQLTLAIAFGASVLLGLGLYFLAQPVANAVFQEPQLVPLLQLAGLMVPLAVMNDMLIGASRGFRRMHFSVLAQDIAHLLVRLSLLGLLYFVGMNAFWAIATYGVADLISVIILGFLLNGVFPWKRPLNTARHATGEVLRFSIPLFLSEMLKRFRGDIQTILLGAMYTVSSVGVFTVANKINVVGRISSLSLMASAEPAFAELHERGDRVQMKELYCATSRWMFLLNFPVVLLTVLFATPILALFGESFTTGTTALILLSLATLANICTGLAGTIIDMTGYTKLKLVNSVAQLTLFVVTSVLFIPTWGVIGAAAAAMLSGSIIQIARLVQVSYLFKMHPYDSWFARAAAAALLTTLLGFLTRWYFGTDANIIYAALHSLLLMGVYGGALLLIGLAPHDQLLAWRMVGRVRSLLFKQKGPAKAFAGSAE